MQEILTGVRWDLNLGKKQQEQTHKHGVELFMHGARILSNGDHVFLVFRKHTLKEPYFFFFLTSGENNEIDLLSTFLRHFIFDGAILLITKLKFFSDNTDLFFKPER